MNFRPDRRLTKEAFLRAAAFMLTGLLAFLLFFSEALAVERGITGAVNIESDQLSYDRDTDSYHASGNVVITFTDGFLVADSVVYHKKTGDAFADGEVFISSKDDTLEGDKVRYNLSSRTGVVYGGKAFLAENNLYLQGKEIRKKGEDTYFVRDAVATTCDGDQPAWRFTGKELDVTVEGYGTLKHGTFDLRNIPVFYAPYFIFPAKTKRQTGFLLPRVSHSRDVNGWDIELPFFWALSDNADATFYQRYLEKRGWKEGMEFRYAFSKDSFGTFYADYLNDTKDINSLNNPAMEDGPGRLWTGNQRRWSYYLNNETTFTPGFYLRTDIARVSDHWYFRDFTDSNYYLDNYSQTGANKFQRVSFFGDKSLATLDSTARIVKDWRLYNLTVAGRYTDNLASDTNDATLQSYPRAAFTGVKQPVFRSPLFFELASSYQYAYRVTGEKGHWTDVNPVFSLPRSFGDYLQVTPSAGLRGTAWEGRGGAEDKNGDRTLYTLGLNASSEAHRIFDVKLGSIDKIRHGIKPEITYSYIPNAGQDNMPDFVTPVPETNTVTYALTNTIIARKREKTEKKAETITYLEFLRFKLSQTFDLREYRSSKAEAERRPFSPVSMEFDLVPGKYLRYRSQATYDANDGEWKTINHDLTISDGRGDSATISYRYTQDVLQEIDLNLKARVTKAMDIKYLQRRNEYDHKDLEKTFALDYRKQCWGVEFSYSDLDNDRRFMATFSLYGLGKGGGAGARPEPIRP
jgi:LPS-assembly protein